MAEKSSVFNEFAEIKDIKCTYLSSIYFIGLYVLCVCSLVKVKGVWIYLVLPSCDLLLETNGWSDQEMKIIDQFVRI